MWVMHHGPLMAVGFFATLIATERALARKVALAYLSPLLGVATTAALLAGVTWLAPLLATTSAIVFAVVVGYGYFAARSIQAGVSVGGALALVWANALWATGHSYFDAVRGWLVFLVLTVASERFELSRFSPRANSTRKAFVATALLMMVSLPLSIAPSELGAHVFGLSAMGLGIWLLLFDVARKTVFQKGLARFSGACLLAASLWLTIAGFIALTQGLRPPAYDAVLHAVFLGFGVSMIFGHAPMLLGFALGVRIRYWSAFWFHAALMQLSVFLRVVADWQSWHNVRPWAGILHALALVAFLAATLTAVVRAKQAQAATSA
ncbi:MAG: hypothetical protein FWD73_08705 [Polyangiaceae bacterium]|nr:hypothetical protein [Polyangiaceae bacterium]